MVLRSANDVRAEADAEHAATLAAARRLATRAQCELQARAVHIFGSRARRDWHLGSDADIFVISERFAGMRPWDRWLEIEALWDGPVAIQPHGLTPGEWEHAVGKFGLVDMALHDGMVDLLAVDSAPCSERAQGFLDSGAGFDVGVR